jgi:hypothetical protein
MFPASLADLVGCVWASRHPACENYSTGLASLNPGFTDPFASPTG